MTDGVIRGALRAVLDWAQASSLRYVYVNGGCCADELMQAVGCRYDLERFGALSEKDPAFADLLIISGPVTKKAEPEIKKLYDQMSEPKYVMAIGSCACSGGAFGPEATEGLTLPGAQAAIPVDVLVGGCPPRPEAIIDGLIALQKKIRGEKISPRRAPRRPERVDSIHADEWNRL